MKGLSKKEIEAISDLEFQKRYYFTTEDIKNHFRNKKQIVNTVYNLRKKGRIIKLNKTKYFLVPIKARHGKWTDHPLIIADEICNGRDYYIGGWAAANYWQLTDQMPMQVDIYTTRRQGKTSILNTRFVFHRTTKKAIKKSVTCKVGEHEFKILNMENAKIWIKSRR